MNLFRFFQTATSASMARERLQVLLEHERNLGSRIEPFAGLREEILALVGSIPLVIAAKKAMPASDLTEFIAWLKASQRYLKFSASSHLD